ncbi:gamma-glutamyltransferase family protein, partial [Acidobacteria bacterium AH-259-O06]|nr:gamma-glutamyltransferase family protein [Acidobacteria bacterium AH-259-O06]
MKRRRTILAAILALLLGAAIGPGSRAQQRASERPRTTHRPSVPGVHGLVTTGHPLASMAGMQVLLKGGNAIDASVAVLATLNVVRPQMSGAAGNGFMTIYQKSTGRVYSLGATGAAPKALRAKDVTAKELHKGIKAGVVPGLFGGWIAALERFGTMSLAELLEPAIDYAQNGHPIEESVVRSIATHKALFEAFPSSRKMFLPEGRVPKPNQPFTMPDLAATFRKLVDAEQTALKQGKSRSAALRNAFDRFYKGDLAQEMARFYRENGGLFRAEDLASYEPIWAEPVHTTYRGYDVYSSPPTSRGGLEVMMQLNLIEGFDVKKLGHNSAATLHLIAECIKLAKADVYHNVADPKFTDIPLAGLLSKEYAARRRALISLEKTMAYPEAGHPLRSSARKPAAWPKLLASNRRSQFPQQVPQEGHTDSFSVIDKFGNVVACTPTHGSAFGTGVVVGNTGLTFNNGTRLGSTSPYPDDVNYARGGQIAILNNSPIIVLKDGKFVLALGTPGGETIGQTQFQALLNVLDFGMSIQEAIAAPRFALVADPNFYKPGASLKLRIESRVSQEEVRKLEKMGHKTEWAS